MPRATPEFRAASSPGHGVVRGVRYPDFGARLAVGHLQLPTGVGIPGSAPQRDVVAEQVPVRGVEVFVVEGDGVFVDPASRRNQVVQVRYREVGADVVLVFPFLLRRAHGSRLPGRPGG